MNLEGERRASLDATMPNVCPSCRTRYSADALFCALDGAPLATSPAAMAAAAATDPYIGHEIVGPIEIKQLVGIGAMGRVYRGFQKGIDRDVAVKILHRELSANQTVVARFHREAKVASRLAHSNVVHVLLTGQLPDGAMYIVMEYLDGMSLQSALAASGGAMPLPRALHVALQLCDAVGEAHAQGVVHRDLKPENVMLVKRGDDPDFVKVLDFGIARLNWGEQSMSTAAGLIFGTARYISPEAAQGEKVTPAGDVYSIAMMFYQMLSGRTAFEADQAVALLVQQIHDPPPPLKSVARASYIPDAIAAAVMTNLSKKPENRAENGREFGRVLLEAAVASGLSAHDILARPGMSSGGLVTRTSAAPAPVDCPPGSRRDSPFSRTVFDAGPGGTVETLRGERPSGADGRRAWPSADRRTPARTEIPEQAPVPPAGASRSAPADEERDGRRSVSSPSNVDATMNEQQQPASTSSPQLVAATSRPSSPMSSSSRPSPIGPSNAPGAPSTVPRTSVASSPPSLPVDGQLGRGAAAARVRVLGIVVACFLVGVVIMAGASRAGLLGARRLAAPDHDTVVTHANDALLHQRWDSPQDDNVRDLTDDGLSRWPHDQALLRIRALACNDIVKAARGKREDGSLGEALRLAKLAYLLDPSDDAAQKLAAELESQVQSPPSDLVPPLATARPASGASAASAGTRATIDASNAKPGVAQPVEFSARVGGAVAGIHAHVEAASFRVSGPGIASGTVLDAVDDGTGVFRTTFAFLQPGRFEVVFGARADGAPVRAARVVQVAQAGPAAPAVEPKTAAPPPASSGDPQPAPPSSAKWL